MACEFRGPVPAFAHKDGHAASRLVICANIDEGKELGRKLMGELGFADVDIVSCEMGGPGVRVRLRGYVNRPATSYSWHKTGGDSR
jgi:hypothetical protein